MGYEISACQMQYGAADKKTDQEDPGVGRNTFLSSPHLCFITVFICDLFISRDDPLMS